MQKYFTDDPYGPRSPWKCWIPAISAGLWDKAFPLNRSLPVNWGWWPKLLQCSAVLGCLAKLMGCLFLKAKGVCVVSWFSLSRFDIRIIYSKSSDQWSRRTLRSFRTCYGMFIIHWIYPISPTLCGAKMNWSKVSPQDAGTLQQCCWDVIFSADINGTSGIPRKIAPDKQCRLDSWNLWDGVHVLHTLFNVSCECCWKFDKHNFEDFTPSVFWSLN